MEMFEMKAYNTSINSRLNCNRRLVPKELDRIHNSNNIPSLKIYW